MAWIIDWLFRRKKKPEPPAPKPTPTGPPLRTQVREQMQEIGPDILVTNTSLEAIELTGPLLRVIYVPAGMTLRVVSPVLEVVWESRTRENKLREWDARTVVENMVAEYARGRAADIMTLAELRDVTFPIPDRMLGVLITRMGITIKDVKP